MNNVMKRQNNKSSLMLCQTSQWAQHKLTKELIRLTIQPICYMHDFNALFVMCHIIENLQGAALAIFNSCYEWKFPFKALGPVFLQGASGRVKNMIWMFLCAWFDGKIHKQTADDDTVRDKAATIRPGHYSCPWQIAEKETSSTVM